MPNFPKLPIITPPPKSQFPDLPIITPDPPRATQAEKYGALYYLGIGGLIISLMLVGAFGYGLWATRDLWIALLVVNDGRKDEATRVEAAWLLAHHPAANDRQKIDHAFRKTLPDLPRYIMAEGLTSEAMRADPKGYALMVAKSEGWPPWLRLILMRPMAYGVGEGYRIPWEPIDELRNHPDPAIRLWATYTRAVMPPGEPRIEAILQDEANRDGPYRDLAGLLLGAARSRGAARSEKLDEATAWLRDHDPAVVPVWRGWAVRNGKIEPKAPPGSAGPVVGKDEAKAQAGSAGPAVGKDEAKAQTGSTGAVVGKGEPNRPETIGAGPVGVR